jgi:hypothetical protein
MPHTRKTSHQAQRRRRAGELVSEDHRHAAAKASILLLEDDADLREVTAMLLRRERYDVHCAASCRRTSRKCAGSTSS